LIDEVNSSVNAARDALEHHVGMHQDPGAQRREIDGQPSDDPESAIETIASGSDPSSQRALLVAA
jgi:hypothetical protein